MSTIKHIISTPRFDGYRAHASSSDLECLVLYVWNVEVSEALYPTIQYLEVALRNSIHHAATQTFGTNFWFDNPKIITNHKTLQIISKAKGDLTKRHKPIEADRVVAELNFGFWRALFYNQYEKTLWRKIIKEVFPNAPKNIQQRSAIAPYVDRAHRLRNRIFHHESVWHWSDLPSIHQDIFTVMGWINEPLKELAEICDRFDEIYTTDKKAIEKRVHELSI